MQSINRSSDSV